MLIQVVHPVILQRSLFPAIVILGTNITYLANAKTLNPSKIWQNLHRVIILFLVLAHFYVSFYLSLGVFSMFPLLGSVILFFVCLLLLFFSVSHFFRPAELQRQVASVTKRKIK